MGIPQRYSESPTRYSGAALRYIMDLSHSKTWAAHYDCGQPEGM